MDVLCVVRRVVIFFEKPPIRAVFFLQVRLLCEGVCFAGEEECDAILYSYMCAKG
jgi:hypothetical protein